jgi:transcription elongation factor Elf1
MLFKYDSSNNFLQVDNTIVPSYDLTENPIGTCSFCDAQIISQSYHNLGDNIAVVAYCEDCGASFVNLYDKEWNWLSEQPISHFFSYQESDVQKRDPQIEERKSNVERLVHEEMYYTDLTKVPMNKLTTIFSPSEIEAMIAKSLGEKYVRQYLYRARKKYKKFQDVFGIILNI